MLNQLKFELKSLKKGYLIGTIAVVAINALLLIFLRFTRFGRFPGAALGTVISALILAGFFVCFFVFLLNTFSRLYSRNKGIMTFITGTKGSSILLSRILVIGIALALVFLLGLVPLMINAQSAVDSAQDIFASVTETGSRSNYGLFRFVPESLWMHIDGWSLAQDFFSFLAAVALFFFVGACYRSILAPVSGRFLLAILLFFVGSSLLSYLDILAFLPESWRISSFFMGQIYIDANAGANMTTLLYFLVQIAKIVGLTYFGGWLLDKKLDYSA